MSISANPIIHILGIRGLMVPERGNNVRLPNRNGANVALASDVDVASARITGLVTSAVFTDERATAILWTDCRSTQHDREPDDSAQG